MDFLFSSSVDQLLLDIFCAIATFAIQNVAIDIDANVFKYVNKRGTDIIRKNKDVNKNGQISKQNTTYPQSFCTLVIGPRLMEFISHAVFNTLEFQKNEDKIKKNSLIDYQMCEIFRCNITFFNIF